MQEIQKNRALFKRNREYEKTSSSFDLSVQCHMKPVFSASENKIR